MTSTTTLVPVEEDLASFPILDLDVKFRAKRVRRFSGYPVWYLGKTNLPTRALEESHGVR